MKLVYILAAVALCAAADEVFKVAPLMCAYHADYRMYGTNSEGEAFEYTGINLRYGRHMAEKIDVNFVETHRLLRADIHGDGGMETTASIFEFVNNMGNTECRVVGTVENLTEGYNSISMIYSRINVSEISYISYEEDEWEVNGAFCYHVKTDNGYYYLDFDKRIIGIESTDPNFTVIIKYKAFDDQVDMEEFYIPGGYADECQTFTDAYQEPADENCHADCDYVSSNRQLYSNDLVQSCFEKTFKVHQDVKDAIIRNLERIGDVYIYTDIAKNPPDNPPGYFNQVDYDKEFDKLKATFSSSSVVADVYRATQKFINAFRDGHFYVTVESTNNEYNNIFNSVIAKLPFDVEISGDNDNKVVKFADADCKYMEACDTIDDMYESGYAIESINGQDPFEFLATMFGQYSSMKSPQGTIVEAFDNIRDGFDIISFPIDDLFAEYTAVYNDSDHKTVQFHRYFRNNAVRAQTREDEGKISSAPKKPRAMTREEEDKIAEIVRNFKKRPVREEHKIIPCGLVELEEGKKMNYMQVKSFNYYDDQAELFMQELQECVRDFDENDEPITVILPHNGGGSPTLLVSILFLMMPTMDYRTIDAMRHNNVTEKIAYDVFTAYDLSSDFTTCNKLETKAEVEEFWKEYEVDDLGNGVEHVRTKKVLEGYKDVLKGIVQYQMTNNVRNPTEIVVATDGYCFSSCSNFVYDIITFGGAIVAGYGYTHPGDDHFGAGQCPSGVMDLADYFDDFKNNSDYGLSFHCTMLEGFPFFDNDAIPMDYVVMPVDTHTKYYGTFKAGNMTHIKALLDKTYKVVEDFEEECNADNGRLLLWSDDCTPTKDHAINGGYPCGTDGKWNKTVCVVAACEPGYVVDFEHDCCVFNPCDPRSSGDSSTTPDSSSNDDSSNDDSSNNDSSNNDSSNNDSSNNDSSNNDSSKNDSSKNDSSKNDSSNNDSSKNDSSNNDSSKNDSSKNDSSTTGGSTTGSSTTGSTTTGSSTTGSSTTGSTTTNSSATGSTASTTSESKTKPPQSVQNVESSITVKPFVAIMFIAFMAFFLI